MSNNLGGILKARRKERGLTLTQFSSLSGISAAHITRSERGERLPSGRMLRKFAKSLGFGEVELLKLAGFLSEDAVDGIDKLKERVREEIVNTLASLCEKIDKL